MAFLSAGAVFTQWGIFAEQIKFLRFLRDLKNIFECASRRNLSNHSNLTVIFGKFVKSNKIETARALLACYQRDARNRTEKKVSQKAQKAQKCFPSEKCLEWLRIPNICGANNISAISAISAGLKKKFGRFGKFGRFLPRRGTSLLMSRRNSGNSRNVFLRKMTLENLPTKYLRSK